MYINNFQIIGLDNDSTAPFVSTVSPLFYQGAQNNDTVNAQIFDATGIQSATLYYKIDGVSPYSTGPSSVKSGIELKWSTATEVNNYGFSIERRETNGNGRPENG